MSKKTKWISEVTKRLFITKKNIFLILKKSFCKNAKDNAVSKTINFSKDTAKSDVDM